MSDTDSTADPVSISATPTAGAGRSSIATFALGLGAMLVGFVVIPVLPLVVVFVLGWWLADDLSRRPDARLGWLGWTSLGLLGVLMAAAAIVVTSFDAHFDCGGTLGGFGEGASTRLDTACRDARGWRVVVAAAGAVGVTGLGAFALRRWGAGRSPVAVAVAVVGGVVAAVGLLVPTLVVT